MALSFSYGHHTITLIDRLPLRISDQSHAYAVLSIPQCSVVRGDFLPAWPGQDSGTSQS